MSMLRKMLLLRGGGGGVKVEVTPSANSYFNVVGTVDLREQGGYSNRGSGTGALYVDAPPSQQGGYSNRNPGTGAVYIGDGGLGEPTGWGGWYSNRT